MKHLEETDPVIYDLIKKEEQRQKDTLMMIPSENIASRAVEEAVGSCLGNKYAEGYPKRRYYQGQKYIDEVELIAQERAKKLFSVEYANVQPYSGSPANLAVYFALLKPEDTIMGLSLAAGGHLTHGANMNASSKFFHAVNYSVDKNGYIDFDSLERLAVKHKPSIIVAGTTAYPRFLDWKRFSQIADKVGAYLLADISHIAGLVAAGVYPSPVDFAHIITTTTHKTLRGPRGAMIMVGKKGLDKDPDLPVKIDKAIIPGLQGGPHLNTIAGIAVALKEAESETFKEYAKAVVENAKVLEEELKKYRFNLVTGGTDSHLLLIDLRNKGLLGNTAAEGLESANIIVNRNSVPNDPNPPFFPSGIRIGTPGITSRGMGKDQMEKIAGFIHSVISDLSQIAESLSFDLVSQRKRFVRRQIIEKSDKVKIIRQKVLRLCKDFPIKRVYI